MTYSLRIADMVACERPRERLMARGAASLSTAELIAILIGTGQGPGKLSAVGLGQLVLQVVGKDFSDPVAGLQNVTFEELTAIDGIGPAKATTILAAVELGKRALCARPPRSHRNYRSQHCGSGAQPRIDVATPRAARRIDAR